MKSSQRKKTENPSIYNNTHMQRNMQKRIRKTDEKGKITCKIGFGKCISVPRLW